MGWMPNTTELLDAFEWTPLVIGNWPASFPLTPGAHDGLAQTHARAIQDDAQIAGADGAACFNFTQVHAEIFAHQEQARHVRRQPADAGLDDPQQLALRRPGGATGGVDEGGRMPGVV